MIGLAARSGAVVGNVQTQTLSNLNADSDRFQLALTQMQRLAGIGTLTAGVAHELTNPISIITAACNNLLSRVADDTLSTDELLHYLEMIDHSAWRCARLVQTLRGYSHADPMEVMVCDLNNIIEDALTLVSNQFYRQFNIEVVTHLEPGLKAVICDPNQITQVLINLLTNARDAIRSQGSQGGTIELRSWVIDHETVAAFSVRDSGPGIPPAYLDKIFSPFFTTKPIGEGTGLGLSIVREIVEQHNGRITAENHPDKGAIFTVILPIQP